MNMYKINIIFVKPKYYKIWYNIKNNVLPVGVTPGLAPAKLPSPSRPARGEFPSFDIYKK